MERLNLRTMSPAAQEVVRQQALRLRKKGYTHMQICESLGVSRSSVSRWCHAYESRGAAGLKSRKRGIRPGEHRRLTPDQERDIQRCLIDRTPDQFRLSFALWTRLAVAELIEIRTGVRMPIRTVGLYLERWGFTPQKPLKRAYEQRPAAVAKWLEEEYPTIARRAADENAEIHWGDETGLRSDAQHGRSYSPKGKTPEIRLSAKRTSVSLISTVTNQGKVRFMFLKEAMNARLLIKFFERLCRDAGRKVFLILDNLRVHHARIVQAWLNEHSDEIEVFYLPSYSPELNPDEYLNGALKADVHSMPPMRSEAELTRNVLSYLRYLQKTPHIVARFFRHPKVAYAS